MSVSRYNEHRRVEGPEFHGENGGREDIIMAALSGLIVLAAFLPSVGEAGYIVIKIPGYGADFTVPVLCWFKAVTGIPCPGCGLTRGFVAMARLDLDAAIYYNPAAPPLFLLLLIQPPYRLLKVMFQRKRPVIFSRMDLAGTWLLVLSVILMALNWIISVSGGGVIIYDIVSLN